MDKNISRLRGARFLVWKFQGINNRCRFMNHLQSLFKVGLRPAKGLLIDQYES